MIRRLGGSGVSLGGLVAAIALAIAGEPGAGIFIALLAVPPALFLFDASRRG